MVIRRIGEGVITQRFIEIYCTKDVSMTDKQSDEWRSLPWKIFRKNLYRLQCRIYKAAKEGDKDSIIKLQSLLLGSNCSKYLAVKHVTQFNTREKKSGIDGVSSLNTGQRLTLAADLGSMESWKHAKLRRVFIPERNGKQIPLGIPTIRDRAMQCLIRYALEPVYEAMVSDGSYGFRPDQNLWHVQKKIFRNLNKDVQGYKKSVLELDIKNCFDEIDPNKLISLVILPSVARNFLWSAIKAGVLKERDRSLMGTPQAGVISQLLCNIALHGIEDLHNEDKYGFNIRTRGIRYVDDIIYFLTEGESSGKLLSKVENFLKERGLSIQETKTRLVASTDGFDFLNWHFVVKPGNRKYVCYPSKESMQELKNKFKQYLKDTRYKLTDRLSMLKTIYRAWWNYHRFCDMSNVDNSIWSLKEWTYKYVRKNSNINKQDITEAAKEIFSGHTYKVNKNSTLKGNKSMFYN
jgi:RNA-directed DNA polymerase